jgi:hypothetical protein
MFQERQSFERRENKLDHELAACKFLSGNDKADIILLSEEKKKAAIISIIGRLKDKGTTEERFEQSVAHLQRILNDAKLPNDLIKDRDGKFIDASFYVGSNMTTIAELRAIRDSMHDQKRTIAEGRLFGFPETAIEGYISGKRKDNETLPDDIRRSDAMTFLNFRLSEGHWADEWKTVEARAETVRSLAPEVYDATIKEAKQDREE